MLHVEEFQRSPKLRWADMKVQGWDGSAPGNFSALACQGADSRGIFALQAEKCILRPKFLKHHGCQATEQYSSVWVNSEGITRWMNSQFPSKAVHCCYPHVSIGSILTPGAVFTGLSAAKSGFSSSGLKKLLLFPKSDILLVQLNFLKGWGSTLQALLSAITLRFFCFFLQREDCESVKHLRFSDYKFYSFSAWRALDHSLILCFPQEPLMKSEGTVRIQRKSAISR